MAPTKDWLEKWQEKKVLTACPSNFEDYFTKSELFGQKLDILSIGTVSIPTGEVIVRDPLVYLDRKSEPYFIKTPTGEFPTDICVVLAEEDCARYAVVRVLFSENKVVRTEEALIGIENLDEIDGDAYFGFNVDAGLGCIADKKVRDSFCDFEDQFRKNNPDANMYDDYFSGLFEKSYQENPHYQRSGGDWLNWQIPGTQYNVPIFQSGFGDGTYPVYFGYDEENNVAALYIQFIAIELAYGDNEED